MGQKCRPSPTWHGKVAQKELVNKFQGKTIRKTAEFIENKLI